MKPNGISLTATESGIALQVRTPSAVEDAVWEAVEQAIEAGWSPKRFRREVADAWAERLRREIEDAVKELS